MRRTPIRMKLAAALTVPLLGLFLMTVVEVADISQEVARVERQTGLARAAAGPAGLITSLQNERTWAVVELIGQEGSIQPEVAGYEDTRDATDQAIAAFRDTLDAQGPAAAEAYRAALANLDQLAPVREQIDTGTAPKSLESIEFADEIYAGYAQMITPFLDANTRVSLAVDDAELRQATTLVDVTTRQIETLSDLARTSIMEIVIGGGLESADEIAEVARLKSAFDDANQELRQAGAPLDRLVAAAFPEPLATGFSEQLDAAIEGREVDLETIMGTLNVPSDQGYLGLREVLIDALNERADDLLADARAQQRLYIALAIVTLALAVTLTWLVSRSITKPLRALTRQAKEMAERRLPNAVTDILDTPLGENITVPQVAPVSVQTRDEVADVADALNTVQDTALDLAVEQAVLRRNIADSFVNLGRRNQNLLGRQLDFITELESNETDADALANLFRLDHLATRMRRNAESLLVLAGIEPPRQWAAPVRLTDVIRAALGEVENYQRVAVRDTEPATIIGSAAADLAHLLAELIENALVFSPPDQSVDIRGRHSHEGGYTLAVIDAGLGMTTADVAAANRRLAGAESFTIAPSKYLGHYVAGNLAARHGIRVRLDNSPGHGITATIDLPPTLLTNEQVTSAPVTPPHGHRAVPSPAGPAPVQAPAPLPAPGGPPSGDWWPAPQGRPAGPGAQPPAGLPAPAPSGMAHPAPAPSGMAHPEWPQTPPLTDAQRLLAERQAAHGYHQPPPERPPVARGPAAPSWPDDFGRPGPGRAPGPASPPPEGLARRTPVAPARPAAPPADDQTLLATLGRYAPPQGAPRGVERTTPPAGTARPPAAPRRSPSPPDPGHDSPLTPPDALTRRVRGAQLPQSTVVSLRDGRRHVTADPSRPTPDPGPSRAADVQSLLKSFSAGVQRGLDEARQRAAYTSGAVPVVDVDRPPAGHRR